MINARYLGRLGLHGTKFVGKMGAIVAGVAVASVWEMIKAGPPTTNEEPAQRGQTLFASDPVGAWERGEYSESGRDHWLLDRFGNPPK